MRKSRLSRDKQHRLMEHFVAGSTARGAAGKVPVFGLLKRGGRVYAKVIPNAQGKTLKAIMEDKFQSSAQQVVVRCHHAGHPQLDHALYRPHRRGADPRVRTRHDQASSGHAGHAVPDHEQQGVGDGAGCPCRHCLRAHRRRAGLAVRADPRLARAIPVVGAAQHLFATTLMGIFLGAVARSMQQFSLLLMLVLLPLQMLSGGKTPRESIPGVVQYIMLAAPNTHFVKLAQAILYRDAGIAAVWPQFFAIAVIGAALFILSLARFCRTISTMR